MNEYITYSELEEYQDLTVKGDLTLDTAHVALLRGFCTTASRMLDAHCKRHFYPLIATLYFDMPEDDTILKVHPFDLLEVSTFTTNNDDDTVSSADYYLMCGGTYHLTPYDRIVMKLDGSQSNLLYSGTPQKSQKLIATWGYHEDWSNAWQDSGDTVQDSGGITSSATTVTVSDANGKDIYGIAPRFRTQHLLKIGTEFVYVTDANISSNRLTIRRGVNGSTAASHSNGDAIYVYQPMEEIRNAARRLATWLYAQRDAPLTKQIQVFAGIGTTVIIPDSAPPDVLLIAEMYRRRDL